MIALSSFSSNLIGSLASLLDNWLCVLSTDDDRRFVFDGTVGGGCVVHVFTSPHPLMWTCSWQMISQRRKVETNTVQT